MSRAVDGRASEYSDYDSDDRLIGQIVDDFLAALHRGEQPSIDRIASSHPEAAEIIQRTLPAIGVLKRWERISELQGIRSDTRNTENAGDSPFGGIGDFQLIRELGRGGMGVVYEAEQRSLRRRVALKVFPFAGLLEPRKLERFRQEALAAATLKHDNIVSVYSVGCDQGIHYYAMELVQGQSWSKLLDTWLGQSVTDARNDGGDTSPIAALSTVRKSQSGQFYRDFARLVAKVASALHYAHEQGIIHRDIKPSNLLIDHTGRPWITDFGLAQTRDNRGLTATGELLGTLRYMSPEQAQGKRLIDERTDIYSLGVTAYEMLTLRNAHDANDPTLLPHRILSVDPLPIRRFDPRTPVDLETIIHKAMSRDVALRYNSAHDFAEDLERFADGKTISARRASLRQRVMQWSQRHRGLAGLITLSVTLTLAVALISPIAAVRYASLARSEFRERQNADLIRQDFQDLLRKTLVTTAEALEDIPKVELIHQKIVSDTLDRYRELLAEYPKDEGLQLDMADCCLRMAHLAERRLGRKPVPKLIQEALKIAEPLATRSDPVPRAMHLVSEAYFLMGTSGSESVWLRRSLEFLEELVTKYPNNRQYLLDHCWSEQYLGYYLFREGALRESETHIRRSIRNFENLADMDANHPEYIVGTGNGNHFLSLTLRAAGEITDSLRAAEQSIDDLERLRNFGQQKLRWRIGGASFRLNRGRLYQSLQRFPECEQDLLISRQVLRELVQGFPQSEWAMEEYGQSLIQLGDYFVATRDVARAEQIYRTATTDAGWRLPGDISDTNARSAEVRYRLGCLLWREGRFREAREEFYSAFQGVADNGSRKTMAYWRVTCPDRFCQDVEETLAAIQSLPFSDDERHRLLALVAIRTKQWELAIEGFRRANTDAMHGGAVDAFMLAIAFYHRGDLALSRSWYDRGLALSKFPSLAEPHEILTAQTEAEFVFNRN